MADRQSLNIKTGEDDLKNTFLSVSGNREYMYATGRGSSTIGSDTSLATDEGSSFIYSTLTVGPENEYDDDPENESDDVPKNESDNDPENDSDDVPENESIDDPENDSDDVPENESDNDPKNESDDVPENKSHNDTKNESDDGTENESDNDPESDSDDGPEKESDNDPENDSVDVPENESDDDPEKNSVDVPENESENDPENDSDDDPKNESDDGPENESSDVGPENESDNDPENESDDHPKNESDDHPKNESDDHPKNESDDHPKNESDDHPKNEYDDDSENESDDDPGKGTDFDRANMQFLEPEDITPFNDTPKCYMCAADEKHIQATHFCQSCRAEGIYICYECLQGHNRWLHDHIVDTLSVSDASLPRSAMEEDTETKKPEDCEREKISHGTLQQAHGVQSDSSDTKSLGADASPIEQKTLETVEQEVNSLGETTYSGFNDKKKERFAAERKVRKSFFQDKLYTDIMKDKHCMKQESPSKLQKYGTYSVKSQSDTKSSIITSICNLGNGHLVLADSENCMIKILKEDNYQLVYSHKVEGYPALLCFIERGKLAVAFANNVIEIILVEKEIQVENSFDVKSYCTGLTFGKGNLYVCVPERIDVYRETGEKRVSFRPSLSSNTDQKFIHLNKITMNKDKDTLYIADRECGIVVADISGNVKQIMDQNIAEPNAICTDGAGILYVTEVSSDRVLKINVNDGSVIQVLKEVSKDAHPISLCHDSITNRLIVGVWSSNDLHVYSCT